MLFRSMTVMLALATAAPLLAQETAAPAGGSKIDSNADRASYGIGLSMGRNFKKQQIPINTDLLIRGLRDALTGAKPALTDAEIDTALAEFEREIGAAQTTRNRNLADKNKQEGAAFLAANAKKPGVKTTRSGLQYQVIKEGNGPIPKATDVVSTHYRGTLLDGTEFDSSYARNKPMSFPVDGVIAGWTEALQLMKVGSKYKLFVPAELAYKDQAMGPDIGPNSTLVFEIELLGIQKPESLPGKLRVE